jgi:hypothetical protein
VGPGVDAGLLTAGLLTTVEGLGAGHTKPLVIGRGVTGMYQRCFGRIVNAYGSGKVNR